MPAESNPAVVRKTLPELYTRSEAARFLRLSQRSLDELLARGLLRSIRIRGRRLVSGESLRRVAENGT